MEVVFSHGMYDRCDQKCELGHTLYYVVPKVASTKTMMRCSCLIIFLAFGLDIKCEQHIVHNETSVKIKYTFLISCIPHLHTLGVVLMSLIGLFVHKGTQVTNILLG